MIIQLGAFLLPLLSAVLPPLASLLFRPSTKIMTLRKMYLVSAADYDRGRLHPQPPAKPRPDIKTKRVAKRGKTDKHPHDKWVALPTKLLEADMNE